MLGVVVAGIGESWYGPGFTPTEQASQLSLWAVLASPLIVSFDVRSMTPACTALVTNARAIAVHQDPAGKPGRRWGQHCLPGLPVFQVVNTMQYVCGMVALI